MDLRVAIGGLFVLLGGLLAVYGVFSDPAVYQVSLGINVNLRWGLVMMAFGGAMFAWAWRGREAGA